MNARPQFRTGVTVAALSLALVLGACRSGGSVPAPSATPGAGTAGASVAGGGKSNVVSTSPPRAVGQAQAGMIPVWLTSYAVLPWANRVDQAGRHTFTISNRGLKQHSFAIIQFDGDPRTLPTSANLITTAQLNIVAQTDVIEAGREFDVTVDLPAGRYVMTSLFAQDYVDGMAAAFSVGGSASGAPRPKQPAEGALGVYLLEYGAFASNGQVREGKTSITVQNLGVRAREFAVVRWRGAEDALPVRDGLILLDGLQEVYRFEALFAGEERQTQVDLRSGFSYVVVSLTKGEYEKGVHAQIKVN